MAATKKPAAKAASEPPSLDGLSEAELRGLIAVAQRRLQDETASRRAPGLSLRASAAGAIRLVLLDGAEHSLDESSELHVPAAALPLPAIAEGSVVATRATLTTARSLVGGRVHAARSGRLEIGFDGLRGHAARLGWPLAILRDASGDAAGTWRVTLSSPATLALDAKGEAVFLVIGLGVAADAAAIGKALLRTGGGEDA